MNENDETFLEFIEKVILFLAFLLFLPLLFFISLFIGAESGFPVFVRRRGNWFGAQRSVLLFRISKKTREGAGFDGARTTSGKFLFGTGLYLLPVLINFAFEGDAPRPHALLSSILSLKNAPARSFQKPSTRAFAGGKRESGATMAR